MQVDLERRKELKETSTGASNESQEIFDHFREQQKRTLCLEKPQELQSQNLRKNGSSDFITLHSKDSQQLRLPPKFNLLSADQLELGLCDFFGQLPESDRSRLIDRFFETSQQIVKPQVHQPEWEAFIAKGCKSFKACWNAGVFDESYPQEERVARILDSYFKEKMIETNFTKTVSKKEAVGVANQFSGFKSSEPNWGVLRGFNEESLTRFVSETDESVDSVDHSAEPNAEVIKSVSFESVDGESKTKKGQKRGGQTFVPSSAEEIKAYQIQERERYNNPTSSFVFTIRNGDKRWVAPVAKKNGDVIGRPRDHFLLASERPNSVTILSLVRDAAAKLPKGFGTRNDISELLKESQFINQEIDEERTSSVVSGALDRLHYEKDPCVKYDSNKKLWIYLHIGREEKGDISSERNSFMNFPIEKPNAKRVKTT